MKKGISPLISVVLLIAFVIAVGGILSGWFVSFTKERVSEAKEKGESEVTCSYANLYIMDARWNSTLGKLSLIVENTGSEDLSDFRMVVIYNNNTVNTLNVLPDTTLSPGDYEVFYNQTNVGPCHDIQTVIFKSNTCPVDAKDEVSGTDITDCS